MDLIEDCDGARESVSLAEDSADEDEDEEELELEVLSLLTLRPLSDVLDLCFCLRIFLTLDVKRLR